MIAHVRHPAALLGVSREAGAGSIFFALVGYVLIKLGLEPAPMLLGFVFVPLETFFTATDFLCRLLRSAIRLSAYLCC